MDNADERRIPRAAPSRNLSFRYGQRPLIHDSSSAGDISPRASGTATERPPGSNNEVGGARGNAPQRVVFPALKSAPNASTFKTKKETNLVWKMWKEVFAWSLHILTDHISVIEIMRQ